METLGPSTCHSSLTSLKLPNRRKHQKSRKAVRPSAAGASLRSPWAGIHVLVGEVAIAHLPSSNPPSTKRIGKADCASSIGNRKVHRAQILRTPQLLALRDSPKRLQSLYSMLVERIRNIEDVLVLFNIRLKARSAFARDCRCRTVCSGNVLARQARHPLSVLPTSSSTRIRCQPNCQYCASAFCCIYTTLV